MVCMILIECLKRRRCSLNEAQYYTIMFNETNIKIYWCVKGDVDLREVEVNISFHTPINLDIGGV